MIWTLRLPWTKPPLSLNDRGHWRARAETIATARQYVALHAARQGIVADGPVAVRLIYHPRDRRRRDEDNLVATLKALCDGLVDGGVVPDDTPEYMRKEMPVIAAPDPKDPRLLLVVETGES